MVTACDEAACRDGEESKGNMFLNKRIFFARAIANTVFFYAT